MKDVISIIVPVYNVEKYMACCLDSLVNQSYKKLEIIVIDDGSTDRSGEICDRYAAQDVRIKVIHQKNGGAANAKNCGLKVATGEYLAFVDSDDFVETDAYDYMISLLKRYNADVVQCCYREVYVNKIKDCIADNRKEFSAVEYLAKYTTDWTCGLLWDKLYKRDLFKDIYFEEGHVVDDEFFTYQGIMKACKIVHDSKIVYNYRQRKTSVTVFEKYKSRTILDKLDYLVKRREKVVAFYPELQNKFDKHLFSMLIWLSQDPYLTGEAVVVMKKILNKYKKYRFYCELSMRQQIYLERIKLYSVEYIIKKKKEKTSLDAVKEYFE